LGFRRGGAAVWPDGHRAGDGSFIERERGVVTRRGNKMNKMNEKERNKVFIPLFLFNLLFGYF
jgi:hypothetical protein